MFHLIKKELPLKMKLRHIVYQLIIMWNQIHLLTIL